MVFCLLGFGLSACAPATSSAASQHEVACVGGTLVGMAIGGAIGNQFGGGRGNALLTGAGAISGGARASTSMNC